MTDLRFDNQRGSSILCDLVDVVRCRDCKFWLGEPTDMYGVCWTWRKRSEYPTAVTKRDGYCYLGEKKA